MTKAAWRVIVETYALAFVARAAFPKLAYRLSWPTRLGPRGLVVYITFNTLFLFFLRQFVLPKLKQMAEKTERAREELRQRLGREPTEQELLEHLGVFEQCPELDSNQRPTP
jgi:hypothetical protein